MNKTPEKYLDEILSELTRIKLSGRKALYRISDKTTKKNITYLKQYFERFPEDYLVVIRKCCQCENEWDIIIVIKES